MDIDRLTTVPGRYRDSRTAEEKLNGAKGGEHWREREYSSDPDYSEVDDEALSVLFDEDWRELLEE